MSNANVTKAANDMAEHLKTLANPCSLEQRKVIRRDATTCSELMNYSHEVADINAPEWKRLEQNVHQVLALTANDYKQESEC